MADDAREFAYFVAELVDGTGKFGVVSGDIASIAFDFAVVLAFTVFPVTFVTVLTFPVFTVGFTSTLAFVTAITFPALTIVVTSMFTVTVALRPAIVVALKLACENLYFLLDVVELSFGLGGVFAFAGLVVLDEELMELSGVFVELA